MINSIVETPKRLIAALMSALVVGAGVAVTVMLMSQQENTTGQQSQGEQARTVLSSVQAACDDYLGDTEHVSELLTQYSQQGIDVVNGNRPLDPEVREQLTALSQAKKTCRENRLGQGMAAVVGAGFEWNATCLNDRGAHLNDRGQVQPKNGQKVADLSECATLKPTPEQCESLHSALTADSAPATAMLGGLPIGNQRIYELLGCANGR